MYVHVRQVIPCQQARIDLEEVFGKDAHGFMASLNTEGHHRGAVAAARALQAREVRCAAASCLGIGTPFQAFHWCNGWFFLGISLLDRTFDGLVAAPSCCQRASGRRQSRPGMLPSH